MATDATFDNQLQALATATANFANDKDAAIKNTIITALGGSTQSGGGSTTPTIVIDDSTLPKPTDYSIIDIEGGKRIIFTKNPQTGEVLQWIDVTLG